MLDGSTIGISMFVGMLVLMVCRIPIAAAMFIPGALGYITISDATALLNFMKGSAVARLTVYDLSVIPLFLLMGQFATHGGLSRDLFAAASACVGHIRGGLGMSSILSGGAFGAICGSSIATSATITQVAYPEMRKSGYSGGFSTGTLAAAGTMGILIPPSVPLVVYGILTEQSIAKLFAAALIPGILAILGYLMVIAIISHVRPDISATSERQSWAVRWHHLLRIWPIITVLLAVFFGIYAGLFSPTEGAGVGAVCTLLMGLVKRELTVKKMLLSLTAAAETSALVFMIFLGADMFNATLALTGLPSFVASWVTGLEVSGVVILFAILLLYILLGCVMDEMSMLLLTIPVIFPAIMGVDLFGLSPDFKAVWFGVLVLVTVGIGLIAPPIGMGVIVVNNLAKDVSIVDSYRGVMPFFAWDLVRLVILVLFPGITLWMVTFMR